MPLNLKIKKVLRGKRAWTVVRSECLEALKEMPDNSVDSIVTDPPAGIGFMGKEWDDFRRQRNPADVDRESVGGRLSRSAPEIGRRSREAFVTFITEVMVECLRVLKPGGHALVWALPRTSHWTATAVEDAGFEIRDVVTHLFGTGFPKSMNVAKAIASGGGPEAIRRMDMGENYEPSGRARANYDHGGASVMNGGSKPPPASEWDGWGTALKPASEHWILARKPLIGTVAKNVLEHGTGALNIDGCRVAHVSKADRDGTVVPQPDFTKVNGVRTRLDAHARNGTVSDPKTGRWPANLTLDRKAAAALDEQSGTLKSGTHALHHVRTTSKTKNTYGERAALPEVISASSGGASRFFYVAKGSRKEKEAGLDGEKNTHPTVKSLALMRWLARLITPPGGVVLDPFTGSGSTGCAAMLEGFRFIGIEREREYVNIARARIKHWRKTCR